MENLLEVQVNTRGVKVGFDEVKAMSEPTRHGIEAEDEDLSACNVLHKEHQVKRMALLENP